MTIRNQIIKVVKHLPTHTQNQRYLRELFLIWAAELGFEFKEVVDVLGGLHVAEGLEVLQGELGGHLGRVQLEEADLALLEQLPHQLVGHQAVRGQIVLEIISEHTRNRAPELSGEAKNTC